MSFCPRCKSILSFVPVSEILDPLGIKYGNIEICKKCGYQSCGTLRWVIIKKILFDIEPVDLDKIDEIGDKIKWKIMISLFVIIVFS